VDLSAVSDPQLVSDAIASATVLVGQGRKRPLDTVKRVLAGRDVLLVLDNFEQVLDMRRLDSEQPNLRAVLGWIIRDQEPPDQLIRALGDVWSLADGPRAPVAVLHAVAADRSAAGPGAAPRRRPAGAHLAAARRVDEPGRVHQVHRPGR
jgi:hypothetical protein